MSVVPPPATNLARHRLPRELGGTGRDPGFELDTDELNSEGHGFVESSRRMSFEEYQQTIYGTRTLWHRLRQDVR
jgi:hypothetical protein